MLETILKSATDVVETSKKIFIDTVVKHEGLNKACHEFVTSQAEYTRKAIDTTLEAANSVGKIVTDKEFYTNMYSDMKDHFQSFTTVTQKKGK